MVLVDRPPPHVCVWGGEGGGDRVRGSETNRHKSSSEEIKSGTSGPWRKREVSGRQNGVTRDATTALYLSTSLCARVSANNLAMDRSNFPPEELISITRCWKAIPPPPPPVIYNSESSAALRWADWLDTSLTLMALGPSYGAQCKIGCFLLLAMHPLYHRGEMKKKRDISFVRRMHDQCIHSASA